MIIIPFPFSINGEMEDDICIWVVENSEHASLCENTSNIEIDNEELALYFRLRFGL